MAAGIYTSSAMGPWHNMGCSRTVFVKSRNFNQYQARVSSMGANKLSEKSSSRIYMRLSNDR